VGYVTESPEGATRILLVDNPHHFVDIPVTDVISTDAVESDWESGSLGRVTTESSKIHEGFIDNSGYESLFYDSESHAGLLEESAFVNFDRPQSWDHETGYPRCYSRVFC
jgi:hypothetical protein